MRSKLAVALSPTLLAFSLARCSSDPAVTEPDAAYDVSVGDRGGDLGSDAQDASVSNDASDAGLDAGPDAGPDASDAGRDVTLPPTPISVRAVTWNAASADFGTVHAVAEPEGALAVFSSRGMQWLAGGVQTALDARVMSWRGAAVIPAADGSATPWTVGIANDGTVWRVRDRTTLEDVTGRFALSMRSVQSIAVLNNNRVAFGYEGGVAVTDGMTVQRWADPAYANLVGAGNRLAARTAAGVRVFDATSGMQVMYALPAATGVAFDGNGRLVVTAGPMLYTESSVGELMPVVRSGPSLRAPVRSATRVWLIAGTQLALWQDGEVHPAPDVTVNATTTLLPSTSGDVWVLTNGRLTRYGFVDSPDVHVWEDTVRPVFARRCVPCHLPGGTGNLDLTTYTAWRMNRATIRGVAITDRTMPPPPGMLTAAERTALSQWLDGTTSDAGVDASTDVRSDAPTDARSDAGSDVRDASADTRG